MKKTYLKCIFISEHFGNTINYLNSKCQNVKILKYTFINKNDQNAQNTNIVNYCVSPVKKTDFYLTLQSFWLTEIIWKML